MRAEGDHRYAMEGSKKKQENEIKSHKKKG